MHSFEDAAVCLTALTTEIRLFSPEACICHTSTHIERCRRVLYSAIYILIPVHRDDNSIQVIAVHRLVPVAPKINVPNIEGFQARSSHKSCIHSAQYV